MTSHVVTARDNGTVQARGLSKHGHTLAVALVCTVTAGVHLQLGSPAGWTAYLFLAALLFVTSCCLSAPAGKTRYLTTVGICEIWFILDYCLYGTLVSSGQKLKIPFPTDSEQALSRSYLVGALAILGLGLGVWVMRKVTRKSGRPDVWRSAAAPSAAFLVFTVAGLVGGFILLTDGEVQSSLMLNGFGISAAAGLGRYAMLLFILPSTLLCLLYLVTARWRFNTLVSRAAAIIAVFLIPLVHLAQGRRLMWTALLMTGFYLLERRNIFTLRWWHVTAGAPVATAAFSFFEATKNHGWLNSFGRYGLADLLNLDQLTQVLSNSVGRFDVTTALIANRDFAGYYLGQTFIEAPLHLLPSSWELDRPLGIGYELGVLIYNEFAANLVSQAGSLIGELFANFSWAGALLGFAALGALSSFMDERYYHARSPLATVGYALWLFRAPHHLVLASYAWFPLSVAAFAPLIAAWAVDRLFSRRQLHLPAVYLGAQVQQGARQS